MSFTYYTSWEELEFVLDAVEFVADHGHKLLPFYTFDWNTGDWDFMHHHDHPAADLFPMKPNHEGDHESFNGNPFDDYMNFAKNIVASLPTFTTKRHIPEAIPSELVYFML